MLLLVFLRLLHSLRTLAYEIRKNVKLTYWNVKLASFRENKTQLLDWHHFLADKNADPLSGLSNDAIASLFCSREIRSYMKLALKNLPLLYQRIFQQSIQRIDTYFVFSFLSSD